MINLDEYYLGIITAYPSYYQKRDIYPRYDERGSLDPFDGLYGDETQFFSVTTVVKKNGDQYEDVVFGKFHNELIYTMGECNRIGIQLEYVSKFTDYYEDLSRFSMITEEPKTIEAAAWQEYLPYFFVNYLYGGGQFIYINNLEPINKFIDDYIDNNLKDTMIPTESKIYIKN